MADDDEAITDHGRSNVRALSAAEDIERAVAAGRRLQEAVADGKRGFQLLPRRMARGERPQARALGLKLAVVGALNRLGRHYPKLALKTEAWLKRTWWTMARRTPSQATSRLSLAVRSGFDPLDYVNQGQGPAVAHTEADRVRGAPERDGRRPVVLKAHAAGVPLLSVVIPCFNYGRYVAEAVESVLAQTFADIEVVVVDGGSTDGVTPAIVRSLAGPRVRVFCRGEPHLVGSNRNFGIERARGRYVCCLDADDRLAPTFVEKAVFLLEHHDFDVVSSSVAMFGLETERYAVAETVDLEVLMAGNEIATCGIFRRSAWEAIGGYRDHGDGTAGSHVHEDWEFWIRLAAHGARFLNIEREHLFQYRVHGAESLSRRAEVRSLDAHRDAIIAANADILTQGALDRSRALRKAKHEVENPLLNLVRETAPLDERCLIVMLPWMVLGGAERLLSGILAHLAAQGWRVVIVTALEPNPSDGDTTHWFSSITSEIYKLPDYLTNAQRWDGFLDYLVVSRGAGRLMIVGSAYAYGRLPHLKARFPKLKVFDLLFNTVGHTSNNRRHAALIDSHLVENGQVRDWLVAHGEAPERVSVIPSGIEIRPSNEACAVEVRRLLGIESRDFVVGFSGRWSPEKNPLGFVDIAARLMKNPRMRFVMTGMGQMSAEVAGRIDANPGLSERLSLLVNLDDVSNVLSAYDVLVLPSHLDGRPLVVLEALASGVPVVASRVGGLPELVVPAQHGELCEAGDIGAFVAAIEALEADRALLARYKAAARNFAVAHLDARQMARRFETALS